MDDKMNTKIQLCKRFKNVCVHIIDILYNTVDGFYQENLINDNPDHLNILRELIKMLSGEIMINHMISCHILWAGLLNKELTNVKYIIDKYDEISPVNIHLLLIPFDRVDDIDIINEVDIDKIWKYIHVLVETTIMYISLMREENRAFCKNIEVDFFRRIIEI